MWHTFSHQEAASRMNKGIEAAERFVLVGGDAEFPQRRTLVIGHEQGLPAFACLAGKNETFLRAFTGRAELMAERAALLASGWTEVEAG